MPDTTIAYEWGLKWVEFHLENTEPTEDRIYLTTEQVMRDYDLYQEEQNLPVLTDSQWEDTCYAIREVLADKFEVG